MARYLAERTTPMLAVHGVLSPVAPTVVETRVELQLTVDDVEHTSSVEQEVRTRIEGLLDPASGGLDGTGWPLGATPTDTDIAAALDGVAHLFEIRDVRVVERETGARLTALSRGHLAVLAKDGFRFQFEVPKEVTA
jgi:hypothetical protein